MVTTMNVKGGAGDATLKFEIRFGENAIPQHFTSLPRSILLDIMRTSSVEKLYISNTTRNANDQARAMLHNIEDTGVQKQLLLYKTPGQMVINHYVRERNAINRAEKMGIDTGLRDQWSRQQHLINVMQTKIVALGPKNVSNHCGNYLALNVFDVAPNSLYPQNSSSFVDAALHHPAVHCFLYPPKCPGEKAYHFEIIQGQDAVVGGAASSTA